MPTATIRKCTSGLLDTNRVHSRLVCFGGLARVIVAVSDGVEHMATVGKRAGLVTAAGQAGTETEGSKERGRKRTGMEVPRVFSTEGVSPFDRIEWEFRTAKIKDEHGRAIFQQNDCEIPRGWSQLATNVVASKYFYGDVASGNGCPSEG